MFSIDDYLLVERNGTLYRISLRELNSKFLMVEESDVVDELNEQIDDLSTYILKLSADVVEEFTSIPELNNKYETLVSTDYMLTDGNILDSTKIEKKLNESDLIEKYDTMTKFENEISKCERIFSTAYNKATGQWMR